MSPPDESRIRAIRKRAALAVSKLGLRPVARQIGVTPMGLSYFLEGRNPQTQTLRKLNEWMVRHARDLPDYSTAAVASGMELFLENLPAAVREAAAGKILDVLEDLHRRHDADRPAWLDRLRTGDLDGDPPPDG